MLSSGVEGNHGEEARGGDGDGVKKVRVEHETMDARRDDGGVNGLYFVADDRLRDLRIPCNVLYRLKHVARFRCGNCPEIWPQVNPFATPSQITASSYSENRLRGLP